MGPTSICPHSLRLLLFAACCLAGCATPNLQPFADQTVRLAGAVSGEQREVSLKFKQVVELYDQACAAARRAAARQGKGGTPRDCTMAETRESNEKSYAESRRVIDGLLERAANYATALADLANAGETGAEAAQSLLGTVKQFGTVLGVTGTAITGTVVAAVEKIAAAVTRIQAQRSLQEATSAAQEAVAALADAIAVIYKDTDGKIVVALSTDEYYLLQTLAGRDLVGLFREASTSREAVSQRLRARAAVLGDLLKCGTAAPPDKTKECVALESELSNAEDLSRLLDRLRPEYDAYMFKQAAATQWESARRENSALIVKAAAAWKDEHARVADLLKRCGGLNAHRCAQLDPATLRALVDQINEIRSLKEK